MKLVNWNVEWAGPKSPRTAEILSRIDSHDSEIICLTESHKELLVGAVGTPSPLRPTMGMASMRIDARSCCGRGRRGSASMIWGWIR